MTTKVRVQYPTPNHLPFNVKVQSRRGEEWVDTGDVFTLSKETNWVEVYVHQFQRLVIEELVVPEVPASAPNANLTYPGPVVRIC